MTVKYGVLHNLTILEMLDDDSLENRRSYTSVPDAIRINDDDRPARADAEARRLSALHPRWTEEQTLALKKRRKVRIQSTAFSVR